MPRLLTCGDARSDLQICALNPASRMVSHHHGRRSFPDRYHSRRVGQRVTGRTVSCSSRTRGRCDSSRGEFGLISRQHGDGDRLQSLPALPPRRASSCRALVDHVPDHPAQGEEQPAQPRKAPALATAPRTPGDERAHRQPDRRRQAKRPNALSTHPLNITEPGRAALPRNIRLNPAGPSSGPPAPFDLRTNLA